MRTKRDKTNWDILRNVLVGILLSGPTRGPSLHSSQIVFFRGFSCFAWILVCCVYCVEAERLVRYHYQLHAPPPHPACLPISWALDNPPCQYMDPGITRLVKTNINFFYVTHFFNLCPPTRYTFLAINGPCCMAPLDPVAQLGGGERGRESRVPQIVITATQICFAANAFLNW